MSTAVKHNCLDYVTTLLQYCDMCRHPSKFNKIKNIWQLWPSKYDYWLRKCKHCRILFSVHLNAYFVELFRNGEYPQIQYGNHVIVNWDLAFTIAVSTCFRHLLRHRDCAAYWISDKFATVGAQDALVSFIAMSVQHISRGIQYTGNDHHGKVVILEINKGAQSIHDMLWVFLKHTNKIRSYESWLKLKQWGGVRKNFNSCVNSTRKCSEKFDRKLKKGVPLNKPVISDFMFTTLIYNEIFINLWYKDEKSDIYQQNWQEAFKWILPKYIDWKSCIPYVMNKRIHGLQLRSIRCQWKDCNNKYYIDNQNDGDRIKLKKCRRCKYSRYCSSKCQKLDWNHGLHKTICNFLR